MNDPAALSLIALTSYLGRQPILNRQGSLVAYELLFRSLSEKEVRDVDPTRATADVVIGALCEQGVDRALGGHVGFVNAGRDWLMSDMLNVLPPRQFVIEILETVEFDERLAERVGALKEAGYRFAVDDVGEDTQWRGGVFEDADFIKVDVQLWEPNALVRFVTAMHCAGKRVVAEKVETPAQYFTTFQAGCDYFQGFYFAHPQVLATRKIPPQRQSLVKLMMMLNMEPSLADLEEEVKRNPTLTMHLLRFVNSASLGRTTPIASVREAIAIVGMSWLNRWALLTLYADGGTTSRASNALVQLVGTRARFMELAAKRMRPGDDDFSDAAFMTGMFSLLHFVLERSVADLADELHVAQPVAEALQGGPGELQALLRCAQAIETPEDEAELAHACGELAPLNPALVRLLFAAAGNWMAEYAAF
ncbi:EAL domain-containing protein [Trinickia terrae]|uniref:EAL domain-containing protein n=1 Tax=Trinickia terrae TaxID=2571161 RepID=A0A4U1I830_9BURK|nr:EAL domain-containing protein [Trinickia terrae]TKC89497.1 EAL domain-containing protein [Trinickia terrae]